MWQAIMSFIVSFISVYYEESGNSEAKGEGKAIPLQASTGPDVSSRLKLTDYRIFGK
jgi:hypothetical protein